MFKGLIANFALITEACKREFKLIFSDSAVVMSYMLSFMLVGFFYSYVYSHENFDDLPVAIVDHDQAKLGQQVSRMIDATHQLKVVYHTSDFDAAKEVYDKGEIRGIIMIPKDFTRDMQKGEVPSISVYADASYMLYYKQTIGAVMVSMGTFNAQVEVNKAMAKSTPMDQAIATRRPFNVTAVPLYNINVGYATFVIPVVFIIALQTLQLTGMGIMGGTLRQNGMFAQVFSYAEKRRFSNVFLTLGRALTYLIISMILLLVGVLIIMHVYNLPQRGNIFEIMVFLIPVILSITFMGMTLVNFFKRSEDAIMSVTVFSIPALMLSGTSWPTIAFPAWIKGVSVLVPSTLGVKGFISLTQFGASLTEISDVFIKMWGICIFYFIFAVWTNRRLRQTKTTNSI
ncbi:ABC transporter permease [Myroides odoratimimus]|uniref:ABC transporter permease n=1 Tax=Myroides odoratimimus TaxID=76832 RepID=UPI0025765856|nr:ABC transporter permease [Myroides odoratimimus]MDM1519613.1 ABC transporter permease [Myroides odoratimimus]